MQKHENREIFFEYACCTLASVIKRKVKINLFDGFSKIKKRGADQDFNNNSKKIFFKIGIATIILMTQKEKERGLMFALRRIKNHVKHTLKEEKRMNILRKKFHHF